jgi:hypothetical protein
MATRSPRASFRLSAEHLGRHLAVGAAPDSGEKNVAGWLALGADAIDSDGMEVVNLTSQADLDLEGSLMGHCVADYGWQCAAGVCRILSLREVGSDGVRRRVSTVEIRVAHDATMTVLQHKGHGNQPPCKRSVTALKSYMDAIRGGKLDSNVHKLAKLALRASFVHDFDYDDYAYQDDVADHPAAVDAVALLDAAAGYDWRSPQARLATWENWSRLLGVRCTAREWITSCPDVVIGAEPECLYRRALAELKVKTMAIAA